MEPADHAAVDNPGPVDNSVRDTLGDHEAAAVVFVAVVLEDEDFESDEVLLLSVLVSLLLSFEVEPDSALDLAGLDEDFDSERESVR